MERRDWGKRDFRRTGGMRVDLWQQRCERLCWKAGTFGISCLNGAYIVTLNFVWAVKLKCILLAPGCEESAAKWSRLERCGFQRFLSCEQHIFYWNILSIPLPLITIYQQIKCFIRGGFLKYIISGVARGGGGGDTVAAAVGAQSQTSPQEERSWGFSPQTPPKNRCTTFYDF